MKNVLMFGLEFEGGGGSGLLLWILFGCLGHLNIFFSLLLCCPKIEIGARKSGRNGGQEFCRYSTASLI